MKRRLALALAPADSEACTRAACFGKDGRTMTGRSMDGFVPDMDTNHGVHGKGLVAELLYLAYSNYAPDSADDKRHAVRVDGSERTKA